MTLLEMPTLLGRHVRLEPLREEHREALRSAAEDERIWTATLTRAMGPEFDAWFDAARTAQAEGHRVPFAVRRVRDGRLVGSTSYLDVALDHKRLEIGATWYHPDSWGGVINPQCKFLLLHHAFEVLAVNRVSLITDVQNARSQAAILKLGAIREGVLRAHMISQGGRIRDTAVFSIVAPEWPRVRAGLLARFETADGGGDRNDPSGP